MIETRGLSAMIEAADAMVKSADVQFVGWHSLGAGLVTVQDCGDVAGVRAATDAGSVAARSVGEVIASHVIPNPHPDLIELLPLSGPDPLALRL
ncbi:MAG: BMC domain-containing protein [Candidatus Latescibacterota bacterium]|nr:BMC domain-containing protein [Candidatus Latescibacterota bacterium]